jgi:hypothetical protein
MPCCERLTLGGRFSTTLRSHNRFEIRDEPGAFPRQDPQSMRKTVGGHGYRCGPAGAVRPAASTIASDVSEGALRRTTQPSRDDRTVASRRLPAVAPSVALDVSDADRPVARGKWLRGLPTAAARNRRWASAACPPAPADPPPVHEPPGTPGAGARSPRPAGRGDYRSRRYFASSCATAALPFFVTFPSTTVSGTASTAATSGLVSM